MEKDNCTNHQWCDVHIDNNIHKVEQCDEHNPDHELVRHVISIMPNYIKINKINDDDHWSQLLSKL
jgi:hypothetical protein